MQAKAPPCPNGDRESVKREEGVSNQRAEPETIPDTAHVEVLDK